jgi:hypothetical protein
VETGKVQSFYNGLSDSDISSDPLFKMFKKYLPPLPHPPSLLHPALRGKFGAGAVSERGRGVHACIHARGRAIEGGRHSITGKMGER